MQFEASDRATCPAGLTTRVCASGVPRGKGAGEIGRARCARHVPKTFDADVACFSVVLVLVYLVLKAWSLVRGGGV